jgi:hypothetical protein
MYIRKIFFDFIKIKRNLIYAYQDFNIRSLFAILLIRRKIVILHSHKK